MLARGAHHHTRGRAAVGVLGRARVDDHLRHRATRAGGRRLELCPFRIRCPGQDEHRPAGAVGDVEGGPQRLEAEIGRRGHRIRAQRRRVVEPGPGVGRHGGTDVTAFRVGENECTGRPASGDGVLEHGEPRRTERLEEGDLRFDHRGHRTQCLGAGLGESPQTVDGHRQSPRLQQGGVGIDTRTQPAAGVHGAAVAFGEACAHPPTRAR